MTITLISGPANAGKAQVALEALRAQLARGEEPFLIVPTRADVEHYRRELAADAALLGARVDVFAALVDEVVRRSGIGERALGEIARERALTVACERALGRTSTSARLVGAARELVVELRLARITPPRFAEALGRWSAGGAPARALGELYRSYDEALGKLGCVDREQLAMAALDALRRDGARWGQTPVVVYGFDDLDRLQLDVIETLGAVVDVPLVVSLPFEPGRVAFAGRASTVQSLLPLAREHVELPALQAHYAPRSREALAHLERSLFEDERERANGDGAVRMLAAGGERSELELVASEIGSLLADGIAPEDIAVVLRLDRPTADLLEDVFTRASLPFTLQRTRPLSDTAIGGALVGLLRCGGPHGTLEDLLAWLRAPGVLERPELADRLEASARRSGALGAAAASELWQASHWRLDVIDHVRDAAGRGPRALVERTVRELQWLFSRPRMGAAALLDGDELDEARALSTGIAALGELAELARSSPELAPSGPDELARTLESVPLSSGNPPSAGAVAVLDPLALRARRVRALFLCRLQEGVFPELSEERTLIGADDRRALARASGLRIGAQEDPLAAERYLFYAAVSRPEELLVLSWHTADEDGSPRARSLFVDDVCDLFDDRLSVESSPGQDSSGRRRAGAGGEIAGRRDGEPRRGGPGGQGADLPAGLLDERLLDSLQQRVWSASSLELWVRCPVRWFVERLLRARDLEAEPEPLARGAVAHAVLRDTLEGLRERVGSARLTPATVQLACELLELALARREAERELSVAPLRQPIARRRLRADLERYLRHAAADAEAADAEAAEGAATFEPRYLELAFGFPPEDDAGEDSGLAALELGDGLSLRGRIDRVDVASDGRAIVYDYKGAYVTAAGRWLSDGTLQGALYMRAVEQLLGLRAIGGLYQPLRGEDLRPRGVLERDGATHVNGYRTDLRDHDELQELLDTLVAVAREAASQAAQGRLQARPQTCGLGDSGCSYPAICRCQR